MLPSWLVAAFYVISFPVVDAEAHVRKVDPMIENLTYSGIVIEKMEGFTGRSQAECIRYKAKCDEFMKCFGNCAEFLIRASDLNDVDEERLIDDQKKAAQNIQTKVRQTSIIFHVEFDLFILNWYMNYEP
uniref:Secreted protein n=1 Tax=Haemonchus contortus TaxID=6289 RepID=A0A7I4YZB0_HAECO